MADFNIRSDSVNVEQIMQQIRARIREKRGVDYTEEQIRELAAVKLETFLNPHSVRSGVLQQFREGGVSAFENYEFEDTTLFESHRAPLRWIRRLLKPILKLFFNFNRLIAVLHVQSRINTKQGQFAQVSVELLNNLVVETTRLAIEVKNLKMRVESLSSRYDFADRRARALEGIVQGKLEDREDEPPPPRQRSQPPSRGGQSQGPRGGQPPAPQQLPQVVAAPGQAQPGQAEAAAPPVPGREGETAGDARRRRRRRRGRRSTTTRTGADETTGAAQDNGETDAQGDAAGGPEDSAREPGTDAADARPDDRAHEPGGPPSPEPEDR